ncbi:MAG: hypothetical protein AAFR14_01035, partial [Bacteroidota bacterium]
MIPTRNVEKKAERYAISQTADITNEIERNQRVRELTSSYLDSMSTSTIFSIPGLKDYTYDELKQQNLALGLDLKGGQSVYLQVNTRDLVHQLTSSRSGVRTK